jgi:hypothetical protein
LELPSPVKEAIQLLRDSLLTLTSRLPVEITVAGSSGIGPIPIGTGKAETETSVKRVLSGFEPFRVRFQEILCFPNTSIYYLAPHNRDPFDRLHEAFKSSEISFGPSPWPYNPHCTLRDGPMTDRFSANDILNLSHPKQDFVIDTLSIYELNVQALTCHLSFQLKM